MKRFYYILILLCVFVACAETPRLDFEVILPEDHDFFMDLDYVQVTMGDKVKRYEVTNGSFEINAKFNTTYGDIARLELRGYNSNQDVIAWGRTPIFSSVESSWLLSLYFGEVNTIGHLYDEVSLPCSGAQAVPITGTGSGPDNIAGHFFFGGTSDASTLDTVLYYDSYFHAPYSFEDIPLALRDSQVMVVNNSIILFYGGTTETGTVSDKLYYYASSCTYSCGATELTWGENEPLPPLTGAKVLPLGPFQDVVDDYSGNELVHAFMLIGGQTDEGPSDKLYLVTAWLNPVTQTIVIRQKNFEWPTFRTSFAAAATSQGSMDIPIAIYGGDSENQLATLSIGDNPEGITFTLSFNSISGASPLNPEIAVTENGTFIFMGGETSDGTPVTDVYALSPARMNLETMTAQVSRTGFTPAIINDTLLLAGGQCGEDICDAAEILKIYETDTGIDVENIAQASHPTPRIHPSVMVLPTGNIAISGGTDAGGACVKSLELFTPEPFTTQTEEEK
ncbi:hypothetical protein KKF34_11505 [Myxococcota bacterium]|nr:hypothetical protein [Myxococcota bacterium]MBU1381703.1 hypothetical protein [Myxococcota bacterium]MBU1497489.1 hypothetical protein [Myxococcota bacterium]